MAENRTGPKSLAERSRAHRERKKAKEIQLAVGLAKAVLGEGTGEQRGVVREYLEKALAEDDLPGDYRNVIERAAARLSSGRGLF